MAQRREAVTLREAFDDWTPITVHLTGEISERDRTQPYKGNMFAAYPGDIVFSKIDARSGAIGMLPREIPKAVVTSEFPVFAADPVRLESEFVKLVLRTGTFIEVLRRQASGTSGRKRITPQTFQNLHIPLPPPDTQRAIVAACRAALCRAADLERDADEMEASGKSAFETALGVGCPAPLPERPVFISSFKHLGRWGHEAVLRRIVEGGVAPKSLFRHVQIGEVIANLVVGWSPRCLNRPAANGEWGVLKLSAVTSGHFRPSENKALPPRVEPRPHLEVKRGDVLITRGSGVSRLVGATVQVVDEPPCALMICDLIFRVIFHEESDINPAFLAAVLATTDLRGQIEERRTGAAPMMQKITKSALMSLQFPLPSKNEQDVMMSQITDARLKATDLRERARETRVQAWSEFETAIYRLRENGKAASI